KSDDEINELRKWAVACNISLIHLDKLLQILRKRLLPQLPKSATTFLNTLKATYNIKSMKGVKEHIGEYVYLGIRNGLDNCIDSNVHKNNTIYLQINVDGASPYHSSTKQLWPILCKVIYDPDIYSPFPVTLYYGDTKPGNIDEYLNDFIEEINLLQKDGIYIDEQKYAVQLKHIICDIPARKFLKQIKGHCGYAACERYQSFREQRQEEHHTNISPLLRIQPPIDLIYAFPLDYMHLCCLGIVKRFYVMDLVFNKTAVKLKSSLREELFKQITSIKYFVPDEFQRKPRPFVPNMKASELRFLVLYAGPVIFKNILNPNLYDHFLLLHVALRILCMKNAQSYLKKYFLLLPQFYGEESHVLNAHYLLHLADDVQLEHTLNDISAFPFENQLRLMNKLLRTANKPLAQICRRIHEKNIINKKVTIQPVLSIIRQTKVPDNRQLLLKLRYKNFSISAKQPNNIFMLNDDRIIKVASLGYCCEPIDDLEITGVCWLKKKAIFESPTSSTDLHMWQLEAKPSKGIVKFQLKDIKFKVVQMRLTYKKNNLEYERIFAIPLLHM
ncbi:hypothetical protein ALC62_07806, partial [Cyphomyrmex costatus]